MKAKNAFIIISLFLLLFLTVSYVSADDDRSYTIDQAFVDLTVENNGLLHVDERYDYSFDGKFNGVYRDIPLKDGESIENIEIHVNGAYGEYVETDDDGYKHLKIYLYSDEAHTQGIKDCKVSVYISYDMENVVTIFNDVVGLQYKLWGEEWEVGVENLHATVSLPGDKNNEYYLNPQEYNLTSNLKGKTITAETTSIPKGEFYELLVLMPLDDFDDSTYAEHSNQNGREMIMKNLEDSVNGRNFWNSAYIILGLLSILSPVGAVVTYVLYGREPKVDYDGIYERELPTNDPPEVVNALVGNKKDIGTPNIKGFEASIMNLIDKGAFKLHTAADENIKTNELILTFNYDMRSELSSAEKIVFDTLKHFSYNKELNLSRLNGQLSSQSNAQSFIDRINNWEKEVENQINTEEFFDATGSKLISAISTAGIGFGAVIAALGLMANLSNGVYSLAGGVFLIIFSIVLKHVNEDIFGRWTESGRVYYLKWNSFRKFLKDNSLIKEHPPESIVIWKKYLIYGASLGVADKVYKSMKLQMPHITDYDDGLFMYHYYGGYGMMYSAYNMSHSTISSSGDTGGFGGLGGGSGGGGGGAF